MYNLFLWYYFYMTYYDELIASIETSISKKDYDNAYKLIYEELKMPYIPVDIEEKLNKYLYDLKQTKINTKSLSDEDICTYLMGDFEHQLVACSALNNKNLRDYIDVCEIYLKSDGFANSKALLIDSLIRQEVNYEFTYVNNGSLLKFNPKDIIPVENTPEFKECNAKFLDYYLKDPSKYQMAVELLYKEALLTLPNSIDSNNTYNKIIRYIDDAFSAN